MWGEFDTRASLKKFEDWRLRGARALMVSIRINYSSQPPSPCFHRVREGRLGTVYRWRFKQESLSYCRIVCLRSTCTFETTSMADGVQLSEPLNTEQFTSIRFSDRHKIHQYVMVMWWLNVMK